MFSSPALRIASSCGGSGYPVGSASDSSVSESSGVSGLAGSLPLRELRMFVSPGWGYCLVGVGSGRSVVSGSDPSPKILGLSTASSRLVPQFL
jgi:hypothetical protein